MVVSSRSSRHLSRHSSRYSSRPFGIRIFASVSFPLTAWLDALPDAQHYHVSHFSTPIQLIQEPRTRENQISACTCILHPLPLGPDQRARLWLDYGCRSASHLTFDGSWCRFASQLPCGRSNAEIQQQTLRKSSWNIGNLFEE